METRTYYIILYDYYGSLFKEKQRSYFEAYYFDNLSLREISTNYELSRNAIHQHLKRMETKLNEYESKLKLYEKGIKLKQIINQVTEPQLRAELEELE